MIVYLVERCIRYEGCKSFGVFSSREKAAVWIVENAMDEAPSIVPLILDHPEQDPADHLGGAAVQLAGDVGVEVGGDGDAAVPDALAHHLHGDAGDQPGGDVGVAQVVNAGVGETGAAGDPGAASHDGGGGDGEDAFAVAAYKFREGRMYVNLDIDGEYGRRWFFLTACRLK